jgi:uncharacterized protein YukE
MNFETWASILLAVVAVMLAAVTFFATMVGLGIAVVAIWGMKEIRVKAGHAAEAAVESTISRLPKTEEIFDLYRSLQGKLVEFQNEFAIWQQRSTDANIIMTRLNAGGGVAASNTAEADKDSRPISPSYPDGRPVIETRVGGEKK